MPNFIFEIDQNFLPIFIVQIHDISEQLKDGLALEVQLPRNDPELSSSWNHCLLEDLRMDCQNLLFLLKNESLGGKAISLEVELAESILRACSAVRHKLRSTHLNQVPNQDIESGNLDMAKLNTNLRVPYTSYVFLAYLQESILKTIQVTS